MAKNRLITIYEPVRVKSASGAETTTWRAIVPKAWAHVNWLFKGTEREEGKQTVARNPIMLTIWYRTDFQEDCIIELEDKYYDIIKISEGRSQRLELMIEAEAKDNDWEIDLFTP